MRLLFVLLTQLAVIGAEPEFKSIFDGKTLKGWETPVPHYWTVEDGAITGRITKDQPCATNQYLVWTGGELADFELKVKSRLNGEGGINNGFQFRSRLLPDHDVCGYQMDNNLQTEWQVRLYDEFGRHTLAMRGEASTFSAAGERTATPIAEAQGPAWFRLEDWHEYHLICRGPELTLYVDGRLACKTLDNDPRKRELQGIFALQLHSGPPTVVQFKDIQLKILKKALPVARPPKESAKRLALKKKATAWWLLDSGAHGATPWLKHVPGWDKFELNVRAAGPGATPNGNVVLMHGAHFESDPEVLSAASPFTIYLRARHAEGKWEGGLVTKQNAFSLVGKDGSITFAAAGAQASFSMGNIDPTAWHNLVARFDGATIDLFCDGKKVASAKSASEFKTGGQSILIAATKDGEKVGSHFHGELEEAAVWSHALKDSEIAALSSPGKSLP